MSYAYFNREIVPLQDAQLPATSLGLHRGLGIFDLFRAREGKPTFLEDYLDRFENSQKFLNLASLISREEIEAAVHELQKKNGYRNSVFKMVLLADGDENDEIFEPLFFILNKQLADDLKPAPGKLITEEYHREHPQVKSLNYMTSFRIQQRRVQAGAVDVLFHKDGLISETSRSNVFVVKDGTLFTPDLDVLQGITRKNVIKATKGELEIKLGPVSTADLWSADEIFITSTIKEVMPIVEIDGKVVGNGVVGNITTRVQNIWIENLP